MPRDRDRDIYEDSLDFDNIQPITRRRKAFDDDLTNVPSVRSSMNQIAGLRIFTSLDMAENRVIIKLDKEMPEVLVTAESIKAKSKERILLPNVGNGALALVLAANNPDSELFLYESDPKRRLLIQKNIDLNYQFSKMIHLIDEGGFDESVIGEQFDRIVFSGLRLHSSSKSMLTNDIYYFQRYLKLGGSFNLVSKTSSGANSQQQILRDVFDKDPEIIGRGKGGHKIFEVIKTGKVLEQPQNTRQKISINFNGKIFVFETNQALFSKDRLDTGTRILLESVDLSSFNSLLDFGCGWGPIGILAAISNKSGKVVMIDNNPKAVELANSNTQVHGLSDRVRAIKTNEIKKDVSENFDLVLSNPPFHTKMKILIDLFGQIKEKMEKGSMIYLVVEETFKTKFEDLLLRSFGNFQLKNNGEESYWVLSAKK